MKNRFKKASKQPTVKLKPSTYQPSKAELKKEISFPVGTMSEDLAKTVVHAVTVETNNQ